MRAAISLLVLLFSMCGAQTRSTQTEVQTESQSTGAAAAAAAAEVSTQLDVSAELKELRDRVQKQEIMVVELRVALRYIQDELKIMEGENSDVKERVVVSETRLAVSEAEVMNLRKETAAQSADLRSVAERLAATETDMEQVKKDTAAQHTDLTTMKTEVMNLTKENEAIVTKVDDLKLENSAQEAELTAVKTRLAATETEVDNLETEIKAAPKVAFSAGLTDLGYVESGNTDLNLVFSRIITNVGQAYSSRSGFFTAPVRGVYYFRFTVMDVLGSRYMQIRMFKNGQQLMWLSEHDTDGYNSYLSGGLTLQLEVGDAVNMVLPAGYRLYDNVNNHSIFSGFLVFPL
ncbi:hypothetical protein ACEWY4_022728 [Coilia grayii]|uniref:C1q domain-containing protein n=1 Tax=Coilia grayii TaxID=363190 RepID=A0ABD1J304_9TELE